MADKFLLKHFVVGPLAVNCYLLADPKAKDCCVIDPGGSPKDIADIIARGGFNLKFILNTHGHGDHIAANSFFNAPVCIHHLDADCLTDPVKNLSGMFSEAVISPEAKRLLYDGDILKLGCFELKVMHTPGHTVGSISVLCGRAVFTGDTLFSGSVGRSDLPGGNEKALIKSIKSRLMILDDDILVYPGHGPETTIGEERISNPFL